MKYGLSEPELIAIYSTNKKSAGISTLHLVNAPIPRDMKLLPPDIIFIAENYP